MSPLATSDAVVQMDLTEPTAIRVNITLICLSSAVDLKNVLSMLLDNSLTHHIVELLLKEKRII